MLKSADTARRVPTAGTKAIVQKQNEPHSCDPVRLLQLSTAGEVFSEGEKPSESPSADGEIPCAVLLAHGEGG